VHDNPYEPPKATCDKPAGRNWRAGIRDESKRHPVQAILLVITIIYLICLVAYAACGFFNGW
jgi:hypothetical protein